MKMYDYYRYPSTTKRLFRRFIDTTVGVFLLLSVFTFSWAAGPTDDEAIKYLKKLSIEDLTNLEVTSVSKKTEKLSDAAAAIFVITQEDIRRSGVTSIPEALRMVPGLQVARIDSSTWAITSRGFNGSFANKLLVLIDGRSVYTPLFSGVYWDVQDTLLEDIERIEVIRGPGATLWGANAVNGVINIITKTAADTQGGLITAGAGTEEQVFGGTRYGGKVGDEVHYRLYAKYFDRDDFVQPDGNDASDEWHAARGGFRVDWDAREDNTLTVQGDVYNGNTSHIIKNSGFLTPPFRRTVTDDFKINGGNVLGRWQRTFSDRSDLSCQIYYDRTDRDDSAIKETRDTLDFDLNHRFTLGGRQDMVWGIGYRLTMDDIENGEKLGFDPDSRQTHLFSAFVQDEITLFPDRLKLTVGTKLEHNDYSGFEVQPNARFLWTVHKRHSIWGAISRAVRTPSRGDHDFHNNITTFFGRGGALSALRVVGDDDFESEELTAYELGYRLQPYQWFSLDIAGFYNQYDDLRTIEADAPFLEPGVPPLQVMPLRIDNKMDGETYGIEILANLQPMDQWKLAAGYTWLRMQLHLDADSTDTLSELAEGDSPEHQFQIRSYLDLPYALELDTAIYYVDDLVNQDVPSYLRFDTRLGWWPTANIEISLNGENLFDNRHQEFGSEMGITPTEIQRSVYGKFTWHF